MSFTTIIRPRARTRSAASHGNSHTTPRTPGTLHLKALAAELPLAPVSAPSRA